MFENQPFCYQRRMETEAALPLRDLEIGHGVTGKEFQGHLYRRSLVIVARFIRPKGEK